MIPGFVSVICRMAVVQKIGISIPSCSAQLTARLSLAMEYHLYHIHTLPIRIATLFFPDVLVVVRPRKVVAR